MATNQIFQLLMYNVMSQPERKNELFFVHENSFLIKFFNIFF